MKDKPHINSLSLIPLIYFSSLRLCLCICLHPCVYLSFLSASLPVFFPSVCSFLFLSPFSFVLSVTLSPMACLFVFVIPLLTLGFTDDVWSAVVASKSRFLSSFHSVVLLFAVILFSSFLVPPPFGLFLCKVKL